MNEAEHTFPLPELELHKLDEVEEEIHHHRPLERVHRRIQSNIWKMAGIALATGALCGFFCGRARR